MFEQKNINEDVQKPVLNDNNNKYKNIINSISVATSEDDSNAIDQMLEMEKQHNKNEQLHTTRDG